MIRIIIVDKHDRTVVLINICVSIRVYIATL